MDEVNTLRDGPQGESPEGSIRRIKEGRCSVSRVEIDRLANPIIIERKVVMVNGFVTMQTIEQWHANSSTSRQMLW